MAARLASRSSSHEPHVFQQSLSLPLRMPRTPLSMISASSVAAFHRSSPATRAPLAHRLSAAPIGSGRKAVSSHADHALRRLPLRSPAAPLVSLRSISSRSSVYAAQPLRPRLMPPLRKPCPALRISRYCRPFSFHELIARSVVVAAFMRRACVMTCSCRSPSPSRMAAHELTAILSLRQRSRATADAASIVSCTVAHHEFQPPLSWRFIRCLSARDAVSSPSSSRAAHARKARSRLEPMPCAARWSSAICSCRLSTHAAHELRPSFSPLLSIDDAARRILAPCAARSIHELRPIRSARPSGERERSAPRARAARVAMPPAVSAHAAKARDASRRKKREAAVPMRWMSSTNSRQRFHPLRQPQPASSLSAEPSRRRRAAAASAKATHVLSAARMLRPSGESVAAMPRTFAWRAT